MSEEIYIFKIIIYLVYVGISSHVTNTTFSLNKQNNYRSCYHHQPANKASIPSAVTTIYLLIVTFFSYPFSSIHLNSTIRGEDAQGHHS